MKLRLFIIKDLKLPQLLSESSESPRSSLSSSSLSFPLCFLLIILFYSFNALLLTLATYSLYVISFSVPSSFFSSFLPYILLIDLYLPKYCFDFLVQTVSSKSYIKDLECFFNCNFALESLIIHHELH